MGDTTQCLQLSTFGGFRLADTAGRQVAVASCRGQALLAYLACTPGHTVSRDRAVALLWGEDAAYGKRNTLRQLLFGLRRALGPHSSLLEIDRTSLRLDTARIDIDALSFRPACEQGPTPHLKSVLRSYRGAFLEGLSIDSNVFEDWLRITRSELLSAAIELHERLIATETASARVQLASNLVALDPFRETSWLLSIEALIGDQQHAAARRQYAACVQLFEDELGTEPSDTLKKRCKSLLEPDPGKPGEDDSETSRARPASTGSGRLVDPSRSRIAVLPFMSCGLAPALAHSVAGDLVSVLARDRQLLVFSLGRQKYTRRHFSPAQAQAAGYELGVDFVVDGNLLMFEGCLRVGVQLIDCDSGATVWANRRDITASDTRESLDRAVLFVLAELLINLPRIAAEQRERHPGVCKSAYFEYLKACASEFLGDELAVRTHLLRAIELEPCYARALGYLAFNTAYRRFSFVRCDNGARDREAAEEIAARAYRHGRHDPIVLSMLASTHTMLGQIEMARHAADTAATADPHNPETLHSKGLVVAFCGEHQQGMALLEKIGELPGDLPPSTRVGLADGHYLLEDYRGALQQYDSISDPPSYVRILWAASLAQLGHKEEARRQIELASATAPAGFSASACARNVAAMCAARQDAQHWIDGFAKAGLSVRF